MPLADHVMTLSVVHRKMVDQAKNMISTTDAAIAGVGVNTRLDMVAAYIAYAQANYSFYLVLKEILKAKRLDNRPALLEQFGEAHERYLVWGDVALGIGTRSTDQLRLIKLAMADVVQATEVVWTDLPSSITSLIE